MENIVDVTPRISSDRFPPMGITLQVRTLAELKTISAQLSNLIAFGKVIGQVGLNYPEIVGATQTFYEQLSKDTYQELLVQAYKTFGE